MITLFHRPKTRSTRFIFLLEELEAPYQITLVSTRARDGSGAADPAKCWIVGICAVAHWWCSSGGWWLGQAGQSPRRA